MFLKQYTSLKYLKQNPYRSISTYYLSPKNQGILNIHNTFRTENILSYVIKESIHEIIPKNRLSYLSKCYSTTIKKASNNNYIKSLLNHHEIPPNKQNEQTQQPKPKKEYNYLPKKQNNASDIRSFASTIKTLSNMKSSHGANLALKTLRVMPTLGIKPNEYIYSLVISAQAKSKDDKAGAISEELLTEMYNLYRTGSNKKVRPNVVIYNNVINAHVESSNDYTQVINLLKEMYGMSIQPDVITYNLIFKSLSKLSQTKSYIESQVELHIQRMKEEDIPFDMITYNTILYIYLKTFNVAKVNEILQELNNHDKLRPNRTTYYYILNAFKHNITYIQDILQKIQYQHRINEKNIQLDTQLYNMILHSYANCNLLDCGDKANEILQEMNFMHGTGSNVDCKADVITYNTVISAYAKQISNCIRSSGDYSHIDAILNTVEALLQEMYNLHKTTNDQSILPNTITYNSIINAHLQSIHTNNNIKIISNLETILAQMKESSHTKPNVITYTSIIHAISNSIHKKNNNRVLLQKAMALLQEMNTQYQLTNDESIQPNTTTHNILLGSLVKSGMNGEEAHKVLRNMMEYYTSKLNVNVCPDVITYNFVLDAYSKSKYVDAYKNVMELLQEMIEYSLHSTNLQPDIKTYTTILKTILMNCDTIENAGYKAEELVRSMHFLKDTNQNDKIQPDVIIYTFVMNIFIKQRNGIAAAEDECYRLLQEMKYYYNKDKVYYNKLKPDVRVYTTVMKAYHLQSKTKNVLDLLIEAESDFRNGNDTAKPDLYAYGLVLDSIFHCDLDNETVVDMLKSVYDSMERMHVLPTKEIIHKFVTSLNKRKEDDVFRATVVDMIQRLTDCMKK